MKEEKINIAKLLENCPSGMELYSPLCGKCVFDHIINGTIVCKKQNAYDITFTSEGYYMLPVFDNCECMIFPSKDQRDWSKFQRPFKDGDILTCRSGSVFIYKGSMYNNQCDFYCGRRMSDGVFVRKLFKDKYFGYLSECRHATEEEKQKLFDAIKENGYKWNPKEKTLEKLCPFNAGDVLISGAGNIVLFSHINDEQIIYYHCISSSIWRGIRIYEGTNCGVGKVHHCRLATDKQRDMLFDRLQKSGYKYNSQTNKLEKLVVPRFRVGDRIKSKDSFTNYCNNNHIFTITEIRDDIYWSNLLAIEYINNQDNWELAHDKFDITTLKPFESRVLVRTDNRKWVAAFYSHYDKEAPLHYCVVGGLWYEQCIPYNDETKHLLDTTEECYDYYKTWE